MTKLQGSHAKMSSIPNVTYNAREVFGIDLDWDVPGFKEDHPAVPTVDPTYQFDPDTTAAILAGFAFEARVMVQGYHGTGKSTHIEQVAARLKWPTVRINLDGHVSRDDFLGREIMVVKEGKEMTEFREGILPWSMKNATALIFDEYDAAPPELMMAIQRMLESDGRLVLVEQNMVVRPHPAFRMFATGNTLGLADDNTLSYSGVQRINQAQLDRWTILATLNYLPIDSERKIMLAKFEDMDTPEGREVIDAMIHLANMTRQAYIRGELTALMSPRTLISWIQNEHIFKDRARAFRLTFLNKCYAKEREVVAKYYKECMGEELEYQGLEVA
ncbi:MAG: AAA family ATPase [Rhodospirillales bacterium]|nr:AAA family ATPase [Rhodospirillales bacterium]MCB9995404.1 AAA family ATPase [Rhodospirillales bacterium]